jgi:hypothetical protein
MYGACCTISDTAQTNFLLPTPSMLSNFSAFGYVGRHIEISEKRQLVSDPKTPREHKISSSIVHGTGALATENSGAVT